MMKRSTFARTALAALFVLVVAPVPAAGPDMPARGPLPFSGVDSDGNGQVSQEEFDRAHTERLKQRTQSENQYRHMGDAPAFGNIDHNADGSLSRDEFQSHQQQQRMLHQQQQQQYQQRQQLMQQERMNMGGPGGTGQGQGGGRR